MRTLLFTVVALMLAAAGIGVATSGCEDTGSSGGSIGEACTTAGFRCSVPSCADFPTTPGCDDTAPFNGHCPLDHSHCFDPKTSTAYCEPLEHACGAPKSPTPMGCPLQRPACSLADVTACWDIPSGNTVICHYGTTCIAIACNDGGTGDGGADGGVPPDMAPPPDLANHE